MRTLLKQSFLTLIILLSLFNCSTDDDGEDIITPPENTRLKTYSFNSNEYLVTYNTDGYVSEYRNSPDTPGNIVYNSDNKIIQLGVQSFNYNSQGRISEITMPDTATYSNQKTNLTYNNDGLIAHQTLSYVNNSGETKNMQRLFEYNANKELISITEKYISDSVYSRNLISYDSNGNVSQVINYYSHDDVLYSYLQDYTFVYDTKKNPSKLLLSDCGVTSNFSLYNMISLSTTNFFGNYTLFRLSYFSNNNVISSEYSSDFGSSNNSVYTYVYNDKDYPTSVEIYNTYSNGSNSTHYRTWTYETY
ncbi:hypothetical protein OS188_07635 [Xanthomarina sp. F1114]|uniref:hypothetical protein n=1 Tax=Xanthomarina sp. F1114 TaxID=2996019 RepID=UPI00225E3938|nr:hypothetical protein [Xanthomarina sp. F1114]MCX7547820.1 hypothetical protein [Xanthomarina sp. F1114]